MSKLLIENVDDELVLKLRSQAIEHGVSVEIVDPRTLWPLDIDTIARSVEKTGRIVVVHEAPKACGFGAEILQLVCEKSFVHLQAPPARVTGFDTSAIGRDHAAEVKDFRPRDWLTAAEARR
jgi:pyruvate/2-oxoglutarate/acetoin dehydrogenase E1 component